MAHVFQKPQRTSGRNHPQTGRVPLTYQDIRSALSGPWYNDSRTSWRNSPGNYETTLNFICSMKISSAGVFSRPWWDKSEQRWCSSLARSVAAADYTTFSSDKQSTQITERTAVLELLAVWRAIGRYRIHSPINNCSHCRFNVGLSSWKVNSIKDKITALIRQNIIESARGVHFELQDLVTQGVLPAVGCRLSVLLRRPGAW